MLSSVCTSVSQMKTEKAKEAIEWLLSFQGEKRKAKKQVSVSKIQLQKELTMPAPITRETSCVNPSVFEYVTFPVAYK